MRQKILAIDDEPAILRMLEKIIAGRSGCKIYTTNNSLEAPELLEKYTYDLLLLDLKMPGIEGMDILKMIHEENRFEKVIIITAFGSIDTATEAVGLGAWDYILKPFRKERIIESIEKALAYQKERRRINKIEAIFSTLPYEKAKKAFQIEYLKNLRKKHGKNIEQLVQITGIKEDKVKSILKNT